MYDVNYHGRTSYVSAIISTVLFDQKDCYNYDAERDLSAVVKFLVMTVVYV